MNYLSIIRKHKSQKIEYVCPVCSSTDMQKKKSELGGFSIVLCLDCNFSTSFMSSRYIQEISCEFSNKIKESNKNKGIRN